MTEERDAKALRALCALLLIATAAWRLRLAWVRYVDADELEHLHGAWCIANGIVPYRDYFEQHPPLLHALLSVVVRCFDVDANPADAVRVIIAARLIMWCVSLVLLWVVYGIGREWKNRDVGLAAAVLLSFVVMFNKKAIEVRPDTLALTCLLGSVWLAIRSFRRLEADDRGTVSGLLGSGLLFGASVITSQKTLFGAAPFIVAILFGGATRRHQYDLWRSVSRCMTWMLAAATPLALLMSMLAASSAVGPFYRLVLFSAASWQREIGPEKYLSELIHDNPVFCWIAAVSVPYLLTAKPADVLLAGLTIAFTAGIWLIPVPYRQYLMMVCALWAIVSAGVLAERSIGPGWRRGATLWQVIAGSVLVGGLWAARPLVRFVMVYWCFWASLAIVVAMSVRAQRRNMATLAILGAAMIHPAVHIRALAAESGDEFLSELRKVQAITTREDRVLDGWSGLGTFRPHAWYYFKLNEGVRMMIPPEDARTFLSTFRARKISPKVVVLDENLLALLPDLADLVPERYDRVGNGVIFRHRDEMARNE